MSKPRPSQKPAASRPRPLPARPNLEHLRREAKRRLRALRSADPGARLHDAQFALAREYGFASWRALKAHIDRHNSEPRQLPRVVTRDWKPIMDAAYAGDAAKIRCLLKEGADPNILSTTPHRHRPLHRAIEFKKTFRRGPGHIEAARALLEGGADPKLRAGWDGLTALQLAAIGETGFVPLLLDRFQPLDIWHACAVADAARVAFLLQKNPALASARDENQWLPLHYCAASALHRTDSRHAAALANIARALLKAGADPMASRLWDGKWPLAALYDACGRSNNPQVAEILLKAGADPCDNESVYHASDEGHRECLKVLEEYTEPQKLAAECTTCLSMQMHWGRTRGAAWLLAHGADPNALHPHTGNSALHEATRHGAGEKVIALLLRHGADPSRPNREGHSAVELARRHGKTRAAAQLLAWCPAS